jgi:hypothetical protein
MHLGFSHYLIEQVPLYHREIWKPSCAITDSISINMTGALMISPDHIGRPKI